MDGITCDPRVMVGKPVIAGTRLTVEHILTELAGGSSFADLMSGYNLTADQIRAAINFALELVREARVYPVAVE